MSPAAFSRLLDQAALLVGVFGLGVAALVLARTGRLIVSLTALMDLLTAAGLLRLAAAPTLTRALAAGGVLVVRQLATLGLHGGDPVGRVAAPVLAGWQRLRGASAARLAGSRARHR